MINVAHIISLCACKKNLSRIAHNYIYRFSTSRQTLTWVPDTFFTALLSGRISSLRDEGGAIFIDRDPNLFGIVLNYLRTRDIDIKQCDIRVLRHEAEYYNISPLIKRLILCEDLGHSSCGDVLFYGCLTPPSMSLDFVRYSSKLLKFFFFQIFRFKSSDRLCQRQLFWWIL